MALPHESRNDSWPPGQGAAKVIADPVRRAAHHVEGPTLLEREPPFGRGLAADDRAPTCIGRSSRASVGGGPGRSLARTTSPRRLVAAIAGAVVLAFLASGCGSGDPAAVAATGAPTTPVATDPAATTPGATATTPGTTVGATTSATGEATTQDDVPGANEIAGADAKLGDTIKVSALTPKAFATARCAKPILVVLHQPGSILDDAVLAEARAAAAKVGRGTVTLAYAPSQVKQLGDLPSKLGLLSSPGVAVVSRDGTLQNFWTTYIDSGLIGKSLTIAAAAHRCDGTPTDDDAATGAAGSAVPTSGLQAAATLVASPSAAAAPGTTVGASALAAAPAG